MRTSLVSLALVAAIASPLAAAEPATDSAAIAEGKKLFIREWEAGKPANPGGDGLGPMFNARSCAACHKLGGIGGAGPNEDSNVRLLTVVPVEPHPSELDGHKATLSKVHPSFVPGGKRLQTAFILHRFGVDNAYASFEKKVMEGHAAGSPEDWAIRISQRNTPPVFGAGLIDAITADMLRELAATQQKEGRVTGRVAPGPRGPSGPVLGHFGWRGQTMSLKEFVLGACANELGLEVPGHHQATDPLNPEAKASGLDMSEEQANQLIAYVAALPAPRQEIPADAEKAKAAERGFATFKTHRLRRLPCAGCRPGKGDLQRSTAARSGPRPCRRCLGGLRQAAPPSPRRGNRHLHQRGLRSQSPATGMADHAALGVRDSGPYLHDGRAKTLKEAILAHAGESILSIEKFAALPARNKKN